MAPRQRSHGVFVRWAAPAAMVLHKAGIDRVWPKRVEAQLLHENAGDF